MGKTRQVALALGSVLLNSGLALGQAKLGPYVVDSNGQTVGHTANSTQVLLFMDGSLYSIAASRNGFWAFDFSFSYSEPGCAGTEYISVGGGATGPIPMFSQAWFTTDGVLHYSSAADVQLIARQSSRNILKDGTLTPCAADSQSVLAAPHLSVPAPTFTPPFLVVESLPVSPPPAQATFNDVPTDHPFFQFIEALYASGITAGCQESPPLYCPDASLTRGQMAVFLAKALGLPGQG